MPGPTGLNCPECCQAPPCHIKTSTGQVYAGGWLDNRGTRPVCTFYQRFGAVVRDSTDGAIVGQYTLQAIGTEAGNFSAVPCRITAYSGSGPPPGHATYISRDEYSFGDPITLDEAAVAAMVLSAMVDWSALGRNRGQNVMYAPDHSGQILISPPVELWFGGAGVFKASSIEAWWDYASGENIINASEVPTWIRLPGSSNYGNLARWRMSAIAQRAVLWFPGRWCRRQIDHTYFGVGQFGGPNYCGVGIIPQDGTAVTVDEMTGGDVTLDPGAINQRQEVNCSRC